MHRRPFPVNPRSLLRPAAFRYLASFAAVLLTAGLPGAETEPTASPEPPREYVVFMGADVLAKYRGEQHRVVGGTRNALEIKAGEGIEAIPIHRLNGFFVVRDTKFSAVTASIDSLRATSMRTAFDRQNAELELAAAAAIRDQERGVQEAEADVLVAQLALGPAAARNEARQEQIAAAKQSISENRGLMDDYFAKLPDELERDAERQLAAVARRGTPDPDLPFKYEHDPFGDGLRLKCVVSSPDPLEKACLAVSVLYVDPREPGIKRMLTAVQPLGRVAQKPRKVTVSISGLPRSFHLFGCNMHLYGNGQEVATNLSKMQTVVTEEEVYRYFLGNYLMRNRVSTCPPAPLVLDPGEVRRHVDAAGLAQEVHIRVDAQGNVASLSVDEAGVEAVAPPILAAMRFIRFFPGLKNGQPVDSGVTLKLSDLLR